MLAVEFEADIENGMIEIPKEYKNKLGKHVKIIALVDEDYAEDAPQKNSKTYLQMKVLNESLGGDNLIESIMQGMPKSFIYSSSGKSDKEIQYEETKHKYE